MLEPLHQAAKRFVLDACLIRQLSDGDALPDRLLEGIESRHIEFPFRGGQLEATRIATIRNLIGVRIGASVRLGRDVPSRRLLEKGEYPDRLQCGEGEGEFAACRTHGAFLDDQLGDLSGRHEIEGRIAAVQQVQLGEHLDKLIAAERYIAGAFDYHRYLLCNRHIAVRIELDELLDLKGSQNRLER